MTDPQAALFAALAAAQGEIKNPALDGKNPHFKSRFATLSACLKAIRPVFAAHGLAVVQFPESANGAVVVRTIITHSGGGSIESVSSGVAVGKKAQDVGSAVTYLRRYALCAAAGIVGDDDDDGNAAHASEPEPRPLDALRRLMAEAGARGARDADLLAINYLGRPWTEVSGSPEHVNEMRSALLDERDNDPNKTLSGLVAALKGKENGR